MKVFIVTQGNLTQRPIATCYDREFAVRIAKLAREIDPTMHTMAWDTDENDNRTETIWSSR